MNREYDNAIICGDCFDILPKLQENAYDFAFTSPPYNRLRNDKYALYEDKIDDYLGMLNCVTEELLRVCAAGVFINIQKTYYNKIDVFRWLGKWASSIKEVLVWEKSNPMPAGGRSITNAYEFFVYMSDKPLRANRTYVKNIFTTSVNSNMPKEHKAVMSQSVADHIFENFIPRGSSILDPFGGVGTTAIAALKHDCRYTLIEKVELYADMARRAVASRGRAL